MNKQNTSDKLKSRGKSLWEKAKGIVKDVDEMATVAADAFDQKER